MTLPLGFSKSLVRAGSTGSIPRHCCASERTTHLGHRAGRDGAAPRFLILADSPAMQSLSAQFRFPAISGNRMVDLLIKPAAASRNLPAFALVGSAASGKTTVAKRWLMICDERSPWFWFRRAFYPNVQGLLSEFFRALAEIADKRKRIFFFIDDPLGLGSLSIQGIGANAQARGIKCTFILVARTSDWKIHQPHEIIGALDLVHDFRLDDEFDAQEMAALPNYLVTLNIFASKQSAQGEIAKAPSRSAGDTWCSLLASPENPTEH